MINLYIDDYCQNCPEFEPDVNKNQMYCEDICGNSPIVRNDTSIRCEHWMRCKEIVEWLRQEEKDERGSDQQTESN